MATKATDYPHQLNQIIQFDPFRPEEWVRDPFAGAPSTFDFQKGDGKWHVNKQYRQWVRNKGYHGAHHPPPRSHGHPIEGLVATIHVPQPNHHHVPDHSVHSLLFGDNYIPTDPLQRFMLWIEEMVRTHPQFSSIPRAITEGSTKLVLALVEILEKYGNAIGEGIGVLVEGFGGFLVGITKEMVDLAPQVYRWFDRVVRMPTPSELSETANQVMTVIAGIAWILLLLGMALSP